MLVAIFSLLLALISFVMSRCNCAVAVCSKPSVVRCVIASIGAFLAITRLWRRARRCFQRSYLIAIDFGVSKISRITSSSSDLSKTWKARHLPELRRCAFTSLPSMRKYDSTIVCARHSAVCSGRQAWSRESEPSPSSPQSWRTALQSGSRCLSAAIAPSWSMC